MTKLSFRNSREWKYLKIFLEAVTTKPFGSLVSLLCCAPPVIHDFYKGSFIQNKVLFFFTPILYYRNLLVGILIIISLFYLTQLLQEFKRTAGDSSIQSGLEEGLNRYAEGIVTSVKPLKKKAQQSENAFASISLQKSKKGMTMLKIQHTRDCCFSAFVNESN